MIERRVAQRSSSGKRRANSPVAIRDNGGTAGRGRVVDGSHRCSYFLPPSGGRFGRRRNAGAEMGVSDAPEAAACPAKIPARRGVIESAAIDCRAASARCCSFAGVDVEQVVRRGAAGQQFGGSSFDRLGTRQRDGAGDAVAGEADMMVARRSSLRLQNRMTLSDGIGFPSPIVGAAFRRAES